MRRIRYADIGILAARIFIDPVLGSLTYIRFANAIIAAWTALLISRVFGLGDIREFARKRYACPAATSFPNLRGKFRPAYHVICIRAAKLCRIGFSGIRDGGNARACTTAVRLDGRIDVSVWHSCAVGANRIGAYIDRARETRTA